VIYRRNIPLEIDKETNLIRIRYLGNKYFVTVHDKTIRVRGS